MIDRFQDKTVLMARGRSRIGFATAGFAAEAAAVFITGRHAEVLDADIAQDWRICRVLRISTRSTTRSVCRAAASPVECRADRTHALGRDKIFSPRAIEGLDTQFGVGLARLPEDAPQSPVVFSTSCPIAHSHDDACFAVLAVPTASKPERPVRLGLKQAVDEQIGALHVLPKAR